MPEKRKYQRVKIEGQVNGKLVLASEMEILDLSLGGVHFLCTKRILTNSRCIIKLKFADNNLSLSGRAVRSVFKGTKKIDGESMPVYEVALEFENLSEFKTNALKRLIEDLRT